MADDERLRARAVQRLAARQRGGGDPERAGEVGRGAEQRLGRGVGVDDPARRILGHHGVGHALEDGPQLGLGVAHQLAQVEVLQRHGGLSGELLDQVALDGGERRGHAGHGEHVARADRQRERGAPLQGEGGLSVGQLVGERVGAADHHARVQVVVHQRAQPAGVRLHGLDHGGEHEPLQRRPVLRRRHRLGQPPVGPQHARRLAAQVLRAQLERAGGAPERPLELELVRDPAAALAGQQAEHGARSDGQQVGELVGVAGQHGEVADRRQHRVDEEAEREHRHQLVGGIPRAEPLARRRDRQVGGELRGEREHQHRP